MSLTISSSKASQEKKDPDAKVNKPKIYSGVTLEENDDEKSIKPRYEANNQKYVGGHIREVKKKEKQKHPEMPQSNSLSRALGYLVSPVKFITSAFTYTPSDPETVKKKESPKSTKKPRNEKLPESNKALPKKVERAKKMLESPLNKTESSTKLSTVSSNTEGPKKDITESPNVGGKTPTDRKSPKLTEKGPADINRNPLPKAKGMFGKEKKPSRKSTSNKKLSDHRRSHPSKVIASPSASSGTSSKNHHAEMSRFSQSVPPPRRPFNHLDIKQSNPMSFRVRSLEKPEPTNLNDLYSLLSLEPTPRNVQWSSSNRLQPSPTLLSVTEDTLLPNGHFQRFPIFSLHECSNTMPNSWNIAAATSNQSTLFSSTAPLNHPSRESTIIIRSTTSRDTSESHDLPSRERNILYSDIPPTLYSPAFQEPSVNYIAKSQTAALTKKLDNDQKPEDSLLRTKEPHQHRPSKTSSSTRNKLVSIKKIESPDKVLIIKEGYKKEEYKKKALSVSPRTSPKMNRRGPVKKDLTTPQKPTSVSKEKAYKATNFLHEKKAPTILPPEAIVTISTKTAPPVQNPSSRVDNKNNDPKKIKPEEKKETPYPASLSKQPSTGVTTSPASQSSPSKAAATPTSSLASKAAAKTLSSSAAAIVAAAASVMNNKAIEEALKKEPARPSAENSKYLLSESSWLTQAIRSLSPKKIEEPIPEPINAKNTTPSPKVSHSKAERKSMLIAPTIGKPVTENSPIIDAKVIETKDKIPAFAVDIETCDYPNYYSPTATLHGEFP